MQLVHLVDAQARKILYLVFLIRVVFSPLIYLRQAALSGSAHGPDERHPFFIALVVFVGYTLFPTKYIWTCLGRSDASSVVSSDPGGDKVYQEARADGSCHVAEDYAFPGSLQKYIDSSKHGGEHRPKHAGPAHRPRRPEPSGVMIDQLKHRAQANGERRLSVSLV